MANQLRYQYNGPIGQPGRARFSGGLYINSAELRQRLTTLLQR